MKILFLHDWHSDPGGVQPTYLRARGHEVLTPALEDDFDAAVRTAQVEFDCGKPEVVVGAARGGAIAMHLDAGETPLVLLGPAWKRWGTATTVKLGTVILHSQADDAVSFGDSITLLLNSGLPLTALVAAGADPRLEDAPSLWKLLQAVERFGDRPSAAETFLSALSGGSQPAVGPQEAGVPHQFGIGVLLVITTIFAVLFAVLRTLEGPPLAFAIFGAFFAAIALGQMLLFGGRRPRRASVIVGTAFLPNLCFAVVVYGVLTGGDVDFVFLVCPGILFAAPVGALFGYLGGGLVAGVFLLLDMLQERRKRKRADETD